MYYAAFVHQEHAVSRYGQHIATYTNVHDALEFARFWCEVRPDQVCVIVECLRIVDNGEGVIIAADTVPINPVLYSIF